MTERSTKRKSPKQSKAGAPMSNIASAAVKKPRNGLDGARDLQRERKRATDRQAQRMARERTKQYIAHLEKTIEILRKESGSETVSKLLQERNQLASEVQQYRKVMYGMRLAIDGAISGESLAGTYEQGWSSDSHGKEPRAGLTALESAGSTHASEDSEEPINPPRRGHERQPAAPSWPESAMFAWDELGLSLNSASTDQDALGLITLGFNHSTNGPINTTLDDPRYTVHDRNMISTRRSQLSSPFSFPLSSPPTFHETFGIPLRGHSWNDRWWQTANQTYEKILTVGPYGSAAADMITPSNIFHAIRFGWAALPLRDQNNPVVIILREMDEKVFSQKDQVSRVALAIKSHRLMKYYLNTEKANLQDLADWQRPRPSQKEYRHPIAIDFFAWPGLRDRFVKNHAYYFQTSDFSEAYRRHFKFSWPFSFQDTYCYDEKSDTYRLSPLFNKYHRDLKYWRFEEAFFRKYPELLEDVGFVEPDPLESDAQPPVGDGLPVAGGYEKGNSVMPPSAPQGGMTMAEQAGVEGLADLWMTT